MIDLAVPLKEVWSYQQPHVPNLPVANGGTVFLHGLGASHHRDFGAGSGDAVAIRWEELPRRLVGPAPASLCGRKEERPVDRTAFGTDMP